jgi:hypothetical protein
VRKNFCHFLFGPEVRGVSILLLHTFLAGGFAPGFDCLMAGGFGLSSGLMIGIGGVMLNILRSKDFPDGNADTREN